MEENKYYVYLHIKEDTGEPFYVGRGQRSRYKQKRSRSQFWKNIVNKHGFDIIFLEIDLNLEDANNKEIYWIDRIGRRDLNKGPLVNMTDGGDGASKNNIPWNKGKKLTDKHKNNLSLSHKDLTSNMKGKTHSKETKIKCGLKNKGKKSKIAKPILDTQTGIYYDSIHEAYILTPYSRPYLSMMLSGKRKNKTAFIYA